MEALSPTQIESLLAERLKRHEERLKEHRSSLENQKAWLSRQQQQQQQQQHSSSSENNNNNNNNNKQQHPMYSSNPTLQQQHQQNIDPRYEVAFHPNQVFPQSGHKVGFATAATSSSNQRNNNNNINNNDNTTSASEQQQQQSADNNNITLQQQQHDDNTLIPMMNFGGGRDTSSMMMTTTKPSRPNATTTGNRRATTPTASSRMLKKATTPTTGTMKRSSTPSTKTGTHNNNKRVNALENALKDRTKRTSMQENESAASATNKSKLSSDFIPFNDYTNQDILSGNSLLNVVANETSTTGGGGACCTFKPTISEDSKILAQKLRTACGASSKSDVVESMEALHQKATKEKWLRLQAIHEEETRQYSNNGNKHQGRAKTPPATSSSTAAHNRLHEAATRRIKEEKFRQMVSDATQDSTFTPAITARAKSLRRHPGHNVGEDLYSLAVMKHQRDEELQQMRDELEYVTAKRMGNPTIDAVSESIAGAMAESSYERLTKPAHHQHQQQHPSATNTSRSISRDSSNHDQQQQQQPSFHPSINKKSEILARHHHQAHSLQSSPTKVQRRREEKLKALRQEIEQQRMEDCTFQPNTNNTGNNRNQRLIAGSSGYEKSKEEKAEDFFNRNEQWMKKKETKISQLKSEKEKAELAGVTFAPNTNTSQQSFEEIDNQRKLAHRTYQQQPSNIASSNNNSIHHHHHHPNSYLNSIYGGSDHRAWGYDQHLDRMKAGRIIDEDRKERVARGTTFSTTPPPAAAASSQHHHHHQHNMRSLSERDDNRYEHPDENFDYYPPPQHYQHQNNNSSSNFQSAASRLQANRNSTNNIPMSQQQQQPINTNNTSSIPSSTTNQNTTSNHVRNSVLSRAEEALARAMQVSDEQHHQHQQQHNY